jgi:putative membrane protein
VTATPSDASVDDAVEVDVDVDVRRLHPLSPFFDLVLMARQLAVPIAAAVFAGRDRGSLFLAIPTLLGVAVGFVRWLRFTYRFDGRRLVVDSGVFTRKRRVLPLDRIQQVEVVRRLRHRLFGLAVVRIDTAGGGGEPEVDLSVVSSAEAERLRTVLLRAGSASATPTDPTLVRLGVGALAVGGMTGSELAIMLTILFWLAQFADDLPDAFLDDVDRHLVAPASVAGVAVAGFVFLVAWFGLAAAAGVVKNYGFVLTRTGGDLHVSRGLLDRREGSIPVHRLQAVRLQHSAVRRLLGLVNVALQSAGQAKEGKRGLSRIEVPVLPVRDVPPLLAHLLAGVPPDDLAPHPRSARRRAIVRRVVPITVLGTAAVGFEPWVAPVAALAVLGAAVAGAFAYRGLAHACADGYLVARSGALVRETFIVPTDKAQSTRLRSTPLQRRVGLATLWVDVAGRGETPRVRDGDAVELRDLQRALVNPSPAAGSGRGRRGSPRS